MRPTQSTASVSWSLLAVAAACAFVGTALGGCGRPFKINTANGLVELPEPGGDYAYRAIAPEGVVMGVRTIEIGVGDLAFWTKAVTLHFRQVNGYALERTADVRSADGMPGKELSFGHDENGKPFLYRVRLFTAQDRLYVAEAGGAKEPMTQYRDSVDAMFASLRVRCGSWLAPVLASRTCNRW